MASASVLHRQALGEVAQIGSLYDARRDAFLPTSILPQGAPDGAIVTSPTDTVDFAIGENGAFGARAKLLGLEPGLAASYACGMAGAMGFMDFLDDDDDNINSSSRVLLCNLASKREKLNLMEPGLREALDLSVLQDASATHIVTEIQKGSQLAILASAGQGNSSSIRDDGDLDAYFGQFQSILQHRELGEHIASMVPNSTYTFSIHGDDTMGDFKTSDVNAIAQFLGDRAASNRQDTEEAVSYALLPLSFLSLLFPVPSSPTLVAPEKDCLEQFLHVLDELRAQRIRLNKYTTLLQGHRYCVPDSHIDAMAIADAKATQSEQLLKYRYSSLLVAVRSGSASMPQLWALLKEFQEGPLAPRQFLSAVGEYEAKMRVVDKIVSKGGQYTAFNHRRPWDFLGEQDTYVLFYYNDAAQRDAAAWQSHQSLMIDLLDNRRGQCVVVFCDCDTNGPSPRKIRISHIRQRKVHANDMVDEENFAADKSLVVCDSKYFHRDDRPKPQQRRAVRIPCPGQSCDSTVSHEWYCSRCRSAIEYGDQKYLFCDCGYGAYAGYAFRCREAMTHGAMYERYKPKELLQHLQHLKPYRELNILILGETGVGKSTFINAFINYLTFETLDEAAANADLQWIIPCSFSTQFLDEKGQFHQQDVKIGKSVEEADGSHGESATQSTTVYRIQIGDLIVRLIDTPGIGDTRGVEQDKANMAGILSTLASFESLHGILILLKPNSARLTLMFKFCITELLTHLHRDASRNIVFGFTNTRISNYMPGDAFKPLQALMNKYQQQVQLTLHHANTYCFDSESFRYLAALKQTGRAMENEDDFRRSWKRSEEESHRLLSHFLSLEPHLVKGTLSLNRARDLITKLTKPMAEIMDVINRTIRINEDHIQELNDERCKGDELKKRLHFQKIDKVTKPLSTPRTVCTDSACVDFVQGVDKQQVINYRTHCHKVCYLTEVPRENVGDNGLAGCAAFYFLDGVGTCKTASCQHSWRSHMHVWYELEDKLITEKNPEIEAMLKKNKSEIEVKQTAIKVHEKKMAEAKKELKELEDAAARFGLFLKVNSITPYNDEMLAYLDEQIKEEKQIVNSTRTSQNRLNGLLRTRKEYEQQIRILEKEMEAGSDSQSKKPMDERDVEKLVLELYSLKGWGQSLKDIKTAAEYYGGSTYNERHFRAHRSWRNAGAGGGGGWSTASMPYRAAGGAGSISSLLSGHGFSNGHGNGYALAPSPQKYSSLLLPLDDGFGSQKQMDRGAASRPKSMVPSHSGMSLQSGGIREVEPSLSRKLKTGILSRWKRSSK